MASALELTLPILEAIMRIRDPNERKTVLLIMLKDHKLKRALKEIALNVVERTIPLTDKQKKLLEKYKSAIWKIKSKTSVKTVIQQEGEGFLSILLPIVASIISQNV